MAMSPSERRIGDALWRLLSSEARYEEQHLARHRRQLAKTEVRLRNRLAELDAYEETGVVPKRLAKRCAQAVVESQIREAKRSGRMTRDRGLA